MVSPHGDGIPKCVWSMADERAQYLHERGERPGRIFEALAEYKKAARSNRGLAEFFNEPGFPKARIAGDEDGRSSPVARRPPPGVQKVELLSAADKSTASDRQRNHRAFRFPWRRPVAPRFAIEDMIPSFDRPRCGRCVVSRIEAAAW
jgi:hypothetical protein